jgi:hypothetical protein
MLFTPLKSEKSQENKPISTTDSVFIAANTANEVLSAAKNRFLLRKPVLLFKAKKI